MKQSNLERSAAELTPLLIAWVYDGKLPTSRTLAAVLRNDLRTVITKSDEAARYLLPAIISWLGDVAPAACWGGGDAVSGWGDTYGEVDSRPADKTEHPNMRRKRVLLEMPLQPAAVRDELVRRLQARVETWPLL